MSWQFNLLTRNSVSVWVSAAVLVLGGAIAASAPAASALTHSTTETSQRLESGVAQTTADSSWRAATDEELEQTWNYVLSSPLGIAALNQLAIEGFISPVCPKTLYVNSEYGGFQTLLQVQCPTERGVSIARAYSEVRVTFNRFEDSIESFAIERVYADTPPTTVLP